jgi:hypothetical protein
MHMMVWFWGMWTAAVDALQLASDDLEGLVVVCAGCWLHHVIGY